MAANVTLNFIRYEFFESETKKRKKSGGFSSTCKAAGVSRVTRIQF